MLCQNSMRSGASRKPDQCGGRGTGRPAKRASISRSARVEIAGLRHRTALQRGPRAELASARPRREVRVRLLVAHLARSPLDAHLALQRLPVKAHRRLRMREQLAALAALVVRVEDEAALVHSLEQQDAHGWLAIRAHGAKRERRGLGKPLDADVTRAREKCREPIERFEERSDGGHGARWEDGSSSGGKARGRDGKTVVGDRFSVNGRPREAPASRGRPFTAHRKPFTVVSCSLLLPAHHSAQQCSTEHSAEHSAFLLP